MNNVLAGEWAGEEWTTAGNGLQGLDAVRIAGGIAAAPTVQANGLLSVPVLAQQTCHIRVADTNIGGGNEQVPVPGGQEYGPTTAVRAGTMIEAVSLYATTMGMVWGSGVTRHNVQPNEVAQLGYDAPPSDGAPMSVYITVRTNADTDVLIAPVWFGPIWARPSTVPWPNDPEEPEEPEPVDPDEDDLVQYLADRVARYVGLDDDEAALHTIRGQVPIVIEFVRGYTRGRGFLDVLDDEGQPLEPTPNRALRAVIISACARLATNPEQLVSFTTGDYTERPGLLQGFTLVEQGVLRNYRKVWA